MCVLRCLGWEQWQEFMRLPKCMSKGEEGGDVVGVRAPLANKLGQVSFIQGRGDSSDLRYAHQQSPGRCSTETKCPLSSLVPNLCVASFNLTHNSDRSSSPHAHPLRRQPHNRQYTPGALTSLNGGIVSHSDSFYHHSLLLHFVLLLWFFFFFFPQVEPCLTHLTRQLSKVDRCKGYG